MNRKIGLLLLALIGLPAYADEGWKNEKGQPIPQSDAVKSISGLAAQLLVTPDTDWKEKWLTPSETTPHFNTVDHVRRGQPIFVITLIANPKQKADGWVDISCDLDLQRPDGSKSIREVDRPCLKAQIHEDPRHLFMTNGVISFVGDPPDLSGTWIVRVTVKDKIRNVTIPLQTSFVLDP